MATATTTPEAAPANYEEIIAENATEAGSVCLTSDGEAPSTRRNYYSWSNSWSLQTCADKCDGMLADGYGECYGFNLKDKFICTVYFEPVPLAKENTCETCVKRCFTSTSKTPTTSTVTSTTTSTTTVTTAPAVVTAPAAAAADPNKWQTYATFDLRDFFQPFFKDPTFLFMASFSSLGNLPFKHRKHVENVGQGMFFLYLTTSVFEGPFEGPCHAACSWY
jgi:hypothetical protein